MTLENVQKATDIVLKGVVAAGLAVGTFLLTRDQTQMNKSKLCGELLQQNFDYVQGHVFTDAGKALLDAKLEVQAAICGKSDPKLVRVLNNSWQNPATPGEAMRGAEVPPGGAGRSPAAEKAAPEDTTESPASSSASAGGSAASRPLEVEANLARPQWVAVSRLGDSSYSAVNFDVVAGNKAAVNSVGNVLRARWFVNIRAKNTPVANGDNPVIGQLLSGQCVHVDQAVMGTFNAWAKVRRVPCPSDGG